MERDLAVFVDYDNIFWACWSAYDDRPDIPVLMKCIEKHGKARKVMVFADFSKEHIEKDRDMWRRYAATVVDCTPNGKKNKTDFIMLDEVFSTVINGFTNREQDYGAFIIVTGDGDFAQVVARLRNTLDKEVGVFGVEGTMSQHLMNTASWHEFISPSGQLTTDLLSKIYFEENKKKKIITFTKLIQSMKNSNRYSDNEMEKMTNILRRLIDNGYIRREKTAIEGRGITVLIPQWPKITGDNLFSLREI